MIGLVIALEMAKMDAPVSLEAPLTALSAAANLREAKGSKPLVIFFFNEQCGVTYYYKKRLQKLVTDFQPKGFAFAGVRVGKRQHPDEALKLAEARYLDMPFFDDREGVMQERFGIRQSMVFAVVDPQDNLRYLGGVDDSVMPEGVKKTYLRNALLDLSKGTPVRQKTANSLGCAIVPFRS